MMALLAKAEQAIILAFNTSTSGSAPELTGQGGVHHTPKGCSSLPPQAATCLMPSTTEIKS